MKGTTDEMLGGHLDEYLWRERYGRGINRRFGPKVTYKSLITDIATQYPHWTYSTYLENAQATFVMVALYSLEYAIASSFCSHIV
jgi:hypothetical protein